MAPALAVALTGQRARAAAVMVDFAFSYFFKAQPMAGERGAYVRERSDIQSHLKSYRELQASVKKACFISSGK